MASQEYTVYKLYALISLLIGDFDKFEFEFEFEFELIGFAVHNNVQQEAFKEW
jgi:hypothetical protein